MGFSASLLRSLFQGKNCLELWGLGRRVERTAVEKRKKENKAGEKKKKEGRRKEKQFSPQKNIILIIIIVHKKGTRGEK